ncbi:MAG: HAD-IC family P-type ATPase [archaeon]
MNNQENKTYWHQISVDETLLELKSSIHGLEENEAKNRLKINGPNTIAQEEKNKVLKLLFRNFNSLLIYILLGSALISLFSNHLIEFTVIAIIILITGLFGFIQEYHAGKSLQALSKLTVKHVEVLRHGEKTQINKEELVVGDVIVLKRGMIVPADVRVIENKGLSADESILTGESIQKYKRIDEIEELEVPISDQHNMLFAGTSITNGHGHGIVIATGLESEIGKISQTLKKIGFQRSPLQKQIDEMSRRIAYTIIFACAFLLIILFTKNFGIFESLILVGAVAVSGIPESFPLAMTMSLSNGVKRMAKKNAIVKDLSSVETLGTTTVICTDKTGTLTENKMLVEKVFFADGTEIEVKGHEYNPTNTFSNKQGVFEKHRFTNYQEFFKACILCNNAQLLIKDEEWALSGEPTEGAILSLAKSAGFDDLTIKKENKQLLEIPFDPFEKFMITINEHENQKTAYLKGAAEKILEKCTHIRTKNKEVIKLNQKLIDEILAQVNHYSNQTYRVLGIATKQVDNIQSNLNSEFIFEGLMGIDDPIREQAYQAVKECQSANVRVIMITGDHKHTAKSVGKKLGLMTSNEDLILEGHELDKMSDEELDKIISKVVIFSRTTPDHKFRIVCSLQRKGEIVAMTGDGVNDAPALKKADIGVSMGKSGTDVAREASNMVLTDDHFSTIVNAIKEGRTIYSNIRRFIYYLLTGNMTEVILIISTILIGLTTPLTALMILFINLVTSTFPAMALSVESTHIKVMKQKPRNPSEKILSHYILLKILVLVPLLFLGTLALFLWELNTPGGSIEKARTVAFATLIMFELLHTFNARSLHTTIFNKNFFSNKYIFIAVGTSLALTLLTIYSGIGQKIFNTVSLSATEWIMITIVSSLVIIVAEIIKSLIKSEFKEQKRLKGLEIQVE